MHRCTMTKSLHKKQAFNKDDSLAQATSERLPFPSGISINPPRECERGIAYGVLHQGKLGRTWPITHFHEFPCTQQRCSKLDCVLPVFSHWDSPAVGLRVE